MNLRQEMYKEEDTKVIYRDNYIFITKENLLESYKVLTNCVFTLEELKELLNSNISGKFNGISMCLDSKSWCRLGQRCMQCDQYSCLHKKIWPDKLFMED